MTEDLLHIIKLCKENDIKAQEAIYRIYSGKMYALCLRYAQDSSHAKDLLQEGFIIVFEKIKQFKGIGSFEGWMRRIFINLALAEFRKKNFRMIEINLNDAQYAVDDDLILNETFEISEQELLSIIQSLSPQYRMVFNLYAIENLSHKEIAQLLNISEGTSKSNLSRARQILQEKLKEYIKNKERMGF